MAQSVFNRYEKKISDAGAGISGAEKTADTLYAGRRIWASHDMQYLL